MQQAMKLLGTTIFKMLLKSIICNILFFILRQNVTCRQKLIAFLESALSNYLKPSFVWNSAKLMQTSVIIL